MMIKSMVHAIGRPIQNLVVSDFRYLAGTSSLTDQAHHHPDTKLDHYLTLIIEHSNEIERKNGLYAATHAYISTKISVDSLNLYVGECEFVDMYQGIELKWRVFVDKSIGKITRESFELRFYNKHKDLVFNSYLAYVESTGKEIMSETRILDVHTYSHSSDTWETKRFESYSTFETIVMKEELKRGLIQDLDRFIRRKDYYERAGRHWTRNYLLYGPPGTGKTSLVAAMANYLNFDIYDLQLSGEVKSGFDPRKLILGVMNSSILLVEDIDCSLEGSTMLALSDLLSCLAGLWSKVGEARIVIFTTNNKDRLRPTLLCRMDMKLYMGRCCFEGFKALASKYLGLSHDNDEPHRLYPEIKRLIDGQFVTPAHVSGELMKSEDVDVALEGLVRTLEIKSLMSDKIVEDEKEYLECIRNLYELHILK